MRIEKKQIINGFYLVNKEKFERALIGTPTADGSLKGGVIKEDGSFDKKELLAEYDKLGGLITKHRDKVKIGSFYDFKNKRPKVKPEVEFTYRVNGQFIDVKENEATPNIVKALKILDKQQEEQKNKKKIKKEEEEEEEEESEEENEETEEKEETEENLEEEIKQRGRPKKIIR